MHDRRIRFALQLTAAPDGEAWAASAREAETQGYATISLPDHVAGAFAPIPALAAAATATSTVRLSMFVLANDWRHPAIVAKDVATLDVLSGGRVELGIGAGWNDGEYRAMGMPFDPPPRRIERLEEAAVILRSLLAGEEVSYTGTYYRIDGLTTSPAPCQRGGVPLVLGGGGAKILSVAARQADVVSISTNNRCASAPVGSPQRAIGRDQVEQQVAVIRQQAGSRFDDLELNIRVLGVEVGPDRDVAVRKLAESMRTDPDDLARSPFVLAGRASDIVDHVLRVRDELGISYFTVSERHAPMLAPVVAELTGR